MAVISELWGRRKYSDLVLSSQNLRDKAERLEKKKQLVMYKKRQYGTLGVRKVNLLNMG